jgi:hypothetical protein
MATKDSDNFSSLRNAYRLQELAIKLLARRHPQFDHSIDKIRALKKAFHFVNYEGVPGDYVEYGMFEGASFIGALEAHTATKGSTGLERRFWGFDSFEGLRFPSGAAHHRLEEGAFETSYERVESRVRRNFKNRAEWHIVKGFLEDTLADENAKLGIERVAVALFDLDLEEPTKIALRSIRPMLTEGSVLIFDEPFFFKGNPERGEAGAFEEFRQQNPDLVFRRYFDYGFGGRGYVLGKIAAG